MHERACAVSDVDQAGVERLEPACEREFGFGKRAAERLRPGAGEGLGRESDVEWSPQEGEQTGERRVWRRQGEEQILLAERKVSALCTIVEGPVCGITHMRRC